jgi:hypothetical protein
LAGLRRSALGISRSRSHPSSTKSRKSNGYLTLMTA